MSEIHLRQPGLLYSAGGPLKKNKERIKKIRKYKMYLSQKPRQGLLSARYGDFWKF